MYLISLYGDPKNIKGWLQFLDQERVPYEYKGTKLCNFSKVNILVGYKKSEINLSKGKAYIFEPISYLPDSFDNKKQNLPGKEMFNDLNLPKVAQKENCYIFQTNLSMQLVFSNFGFREIPQFSTEDSQVQLYGSLIDKVKIARFLREKLIEIFGYLDLPYVHLWYYPEPDPSVFLFRQDIDYIDRQGIKNLNKVTSKYGIRGTYFLNTSGEEEFEDEIGHFNLKTPVTLKRKKWISLLLRNKNELANHGFWHYIFENFEENLDNITRCSTDLKRIFFIKDYGFAAPGGIWNANLAKALDKKSFLYASNNILTWGGFPYYPYINGCCSVTLEIPCNPISDVAFDPHPKKAELKLLQKYLLSYIDEQIRYHEPVTIMGHPHLTGKFAEDLYNPIYEHLKKINISNMTFADFARWWKKREKIKLDIQINCKKVIIKTSSKCLVEAIYQGKRKRVNINGGKIIDFRMEV